MQIPDEKQVDPRAAGLAAAQHGVFSRPQLAQIGATRGMIDHRLRTGRWERVAPSVVRVAGTPPSWLQSLMVACLAWGDGTVVSHRTAAALWRLMGFPPGEIELIVPRRRDRAAPGNVHRIPLRALDVTVVQGIPVTTSARTLLDIAAVAPRETVEEALDDALRRRLVSLRRLRWRVDELGRRGRPGIAMMRALLDARDPGSPVPESVFETRLLRLLRQAGLPRPVLQHRIHRDGRTVAIVDFAYPDAKLAIEADGYRWHSGRVRWEHDRARLNRLTLLGWRVIHVTWHDLVRRPEHVAASVRNALLAGPPMRSPSDANA